MSSRSFLVAAFALSVSAAAIGDDIDIETVASGLDSPWSVAFLPDGSYLVTELPGALRRVAPDGRIGEPIAGVPPVYYAGQGGLFDVALDPQFERNSLIYLSYAEGTPKANRTAVMRGRLNGNRLDDTAVIFRVRPDKATPVHYGGRLAFDADGYLLLTSGDGFDYREAAQDIGSQLGKLLRFDRDGNPAASGPFADAPFIVSLGHRNPQGLVVASDGGVFLHEHGPRGGDEVNRITPGGNYGWPAVTTGLDYTGALVSPYREWPGFVPPLLDWTPSIAPSGLAQADSDAFPDWRGDLFAGALVDRSLRHLTLDGGEIVSDERLVGDLDERIRDVRQGPDGLLYLLTDGSDGRLLRLRPAPGAD